MSEKTGIEWTDSTWNPTRGCTRVSEGCRNCYAERFAARSPAYSNLVRSSSTGPKWTGEIELAWNALRTPLRWRKPRRIFVDSMSDLFHERVPREYLAAVFAVMETAQRHTFQILTKRPQIARAMLTPAFYAGEVRAAGLNHLGESYGAGNPGWPLPNVWLGTSVEDQAAADERIPDLLATPAAVRFLSCEPLLGPIGLSKFLPTYTACTPPTSEESKRTLADVARAGFRAAGVPLLDWVIAGGESGPGARPMRADWVRELRSECAAAGISFFFKQWGEWIPAADAPAGPHNLPRWAGERRELDGEEYLRLGRRCTGNVLDGRRFVDFPA